jgi:hypothetical protein
VGKHTPGPWEAKRETDYVPVQVWAEGRQIPEVYGECREARAANARLIAAAPELLKALRHVITEFWEEYEYPDCPPEHSPTVEIGKAEHVIRKAKGEETTNVLTEFNRLCQTRDLAAYRAVADIQTVVLFWESQDYDAVLAQLQKLDLPSGHEKSCLHSADEPRSKEQFFHYPNRVLRCAF